MSLFVSNYPKPQGKSISMRPKSWLESLELIDAKTEAPEPNPTVGFLRDIDPMNRRGLLALHDVNCKKVKQEEFMRGYREEEDAQSELLGNNNKAMSALDITATLESQPVNNPETLLKSVAEFLIEPDHDDSIGEGSYRYDENGSKYYQYYNTSSNHISTNRKRSHSEMHASQIMTLGEPWILRMGMYEKILGHFQHYYNDHDNQSITSLLLSPFCTPEVVRTINFWFGTTHHSSSSSFQSYDRLSSHHRTPLAHGGSLSICKSHTMQGSDLIVGGFAKIFDMLPDCIILFRKIKIHHTLDGRVVLQAPYTYFFKMLVDDNRNHNQSSNTSESSSDAHHQPFYGPPEKANIVDVDLRGCLEMHFTAENRISFIQEHIFNCNFSEKTPTTEDLIRYMGY